MEGSSGYDIRGEAIPLLPYEGKTKRSRKKAIIELNEEDDESSEAEEEVEALELPKQTHVQTPRKLVQVKAKRKKKLVTENEACDPPNILDATLWRTIISTLYSHPPLLMHCDLEPLRQIFLENFVNHHRVPPDIFIPFSESSQPTHRLQPPIEYPEVPLQTIFGEVLEFSATDNGIIVTDYTLCNRVKIAIVKLAHFIRTCPKDVYKDHWQFIYVFLIRFGMLPKVFEALAGDLDSEPETVSPPRKRRRPSSSKMNSESLPSTLQTQSALDPVTTEHKGLTTEEAELNIPKKRRKILNPTKTPKVRDEQKTETSPKTSKIKINGYNGLLHSTPKVIIDVNEANAAIEMAKSNLGNRSPIHSELALSSEITATDTEISIPENRPGKSRKKSRDLYPISKSDSLEPSPITSTSATLNTLAKADPVAELHTNSNLEKIKSKIETGSESHSENSNTANSDVDVLKKPLQPSATSKKSSLQPSSVKSLNSKSITIKRYRSGELPTNSSRKSMNTSQPSTSANSSASSPLQPTTKFRIAPSKRKPEIWGEPQGTAVPSSAPPSSQLPSTSSNPHISVSVRSPSNLPNGPIPPVSLPSNRSNEVSLKKSFSSVHSSSSKSHKNKDLNQGSNCAAWDRLAGLSLKPGKTFMSPPTTLNTPGPSTSSASKSDSASLDELDRYVPPITIQLKGSQSTVKVSGLTHRKNDHVSSVSSNSKPPSVSNISQNISTKAPKSALEQPETVVPFTPKSRKVFIPSYSPTRKSSIIISLPIEPDSPRITGPAQPKSSGSNNTTPNELTEASASQVQKVSGISPYPSTSKSQQRRAPLIIDPLNISQPLTEASAIMQSQRSLSPLCTPNSNEMSASKILPSEAPLVKSNTALPLSSNSNEVVLPECATTSNPPIKSVSVSPSLVDSTNNTNGPVSKVANESQECKVLQKIRNTMLTVSDDSSRIASESLDIPASQILPNESSTGGLVAALNLASTSKKKFIPENPIIPISLQTQSQEVPVALPSAPTLKNVHHSKAQLPICKEPKTIAQNPQQLIPASTSNLPLKPVPKETLLSKMKLKRELVVVVPDCFEDPVCQNYLKEFKCFESSKLKISVQHERNHRLLLLRRNSSDL